MGRKGMESPKLIFANAHKMTTQKQMLPFSIKNLDTGEVTYEDPFIKDVKLY